ncbi:MAG: ribosome biogenesis GTPase Der [Deltaproteobacteria bacterium]|jgi:GTP-binding protein|nr:ribosome biogenesis GTPase Der [Deltaproteobacteria bacterium]
MHTLPHIVLVGRPNVGKSTLFNRLIRSKRAITHDQPGITRDRLEGTVRHAGRNFGLVDTGGILLDAHAALLDGPAGIRGFEAHILAQTEAAAREAAAIAFVVDGRAGLLPLDEHLLAHIRRLGAPILILVNKVDGPELEDALNAEFYSLGLPLLAVSGEHGHNVRLAADMLVDMLPPPHEDEHQQHGLRLALLGRPNVGKSSLINALCGQERMIVSEQPGTTRDSVDVRVEKEGIVYTFVDTAGVRRPSRITDTVESFSVNSAIKTTTKAQITLFLLDAPEGVTQQDKRLLDLLHERKTPFIVLVNKMDRIQEQGAVRKVFRQALDFCPHIPLLFISALTQRGLEKILPLASQVYAECGIRIGTGLLNRAVQEVIARHQPPVVKRVRAKFFYLTQAESHPPTFVFFVNDAERVPQSYARYLEKALRRLFGIAHAPMRVRFRSSHKK